MPGIGLVKDFFIFISAGLGIYDNSTLLVKINKANKTHKYTVHSIKWEAKKELIQELKATDKTTRAAKVEELKKIFFDCQKKLGKDEAYAQKAWDEACKKAAQDVYQKRWNHNVKYWLAREKNYGNERFKFVISIIYDLGKMTMISLGVLALIIQGGFLLAAAFGVFGIATGWSGYRKALHETKHKEKIPEPQKLTKPQLIKV